MKPSLRRVGKPVMGWGVLKEDKLTGDCWSTKQQLIDDCGWLKPSKYVRVVIQEVKR